LTTAPLSFVGAAPAQTVDAVVHVKTERLDFVGAEKQ
jgi:hypothetical protein